MAEHQVKFRRLDSAEGLPLPRYATDGSSGLDLMCAHDVQIRAGNWQLVKTGLCLELADGMEGQIRPRSGLAAKHGVTVLNAPATIDNDYRGEVCVILINHSKMTVSFNRGDRIAQLVVAPVCRVHTVEIEHLSETARGAGGFGSTGT